MTRMQRYKGFVCMEARRWLWTPQNCEVSQIAKRNWCVRKDGDLIAKDHATYKDAINWCIAWVHGNATVHECNRAGCRRARLESARWCDKHTEQQSKHVARLMRMRKAAR